MKKIDDVSVGFEFQQGLKVIVALCFLVFLFPRGVFANIIVGQNSNSSTSVLAPHVPYFQYIGSGLSEIMGSFNFYMSGDSPFSSVRLFINRCTNLSDFGNYNAMNGTGSCSQVRLEPIYNVAIGTSKTLVTVPLATPYTFDPAYYYGIGVSPQDVGPHSTYYGSNASSTMPSLDPYGFEQGQYSVKQSYFTVYDQDGLNETGQTRIVSVVPSDGQTVASSTYATLGYKIYINGEYDKSTISFKVHPLNNLFDYGTGGNLVVDYSTTTTEVGTIEKYWTLISLLPVGNYVMDLSVTPSTIWSIFEPATVSTSTMFYVGAQTRFGADYDKQQDEIREFYTSIATTTSATSTLSSACNVGTFNFKDCLYSLFLPSGAEVKKMFDTYRQGIFGVAPFGYVTRMFEILNSTTTVALPAITYTFENDFPLDVVAGKTFGFDFTNIASQASDLVNNQLVSSSDGKSVWGIFETPTRIFLSLVLLWLIISDMLQLEFDMSLGSKVGSAYRLGRTRVKRAWGDL